jgi:superfamily II DNA or RNA helicase/HKD family nuclease
MENKFMSTTKFFTNEGSNTLLAKFEGIVKHLNIYYFDALVGYFRASGYFHTRPMIENVKQVRILVGIDVDTLSQKYHTKGLELRFSAEDVRANFEKRIEEDIQKSDYRFDVEKGMLQFVQDVAAGKIQLRAHPDKNIHAKVYIFRELEQHDHGYGRVITGSSNFTDNGLESNFEFNVELRDNADVDFAVDTFEKLWSESIEILPTQATNIRDKTYLKDDFTPYEIYIKFLITYFGSLVNFDPSVVDDMPEGFKRLSYQIDAVNEGFEKLKQHKGFFLADVVGLGKTVVGALIARKFTYANDPFKTRILIIAPPTLISNWKETTRQLGLRNCDFETVGRLRKVKHPEDYHLVIVDEAHKFRSDTTTGFNELQKICKTPCEHASGNIINAENNHKRVILVSATPLNNRPEDIRNLIYLFQDAKQSTLESVYNLQHFFYGLIERYRLVKHLPLDQVKLEVEEIYEQIREAVIKPLSIRRTRTDIERTPAYNDDRLKQGIHFPSIQKPRQVFYELEPKLEELYDRTFELIKDSSKGLSYARYQALKYLIGEKGAQFPRREMISEQLATIMKTLLIKRLDSSFEAFRSSLRNFRNANSAMLKMFANKKIFIAPDLKGKVSDYVLDDHEDELEKLVIEMMEAGENALICTPDDFDAEFERLLQKDQKILEELLAQWEKVSQDPKFEVFLQRLKADFLDEKFNPNQKLVVFSESTITVKYLKAKLEAYPEYKILAVSSENRKDLQAIIKANFDENETDGNKRSDAYNVIIATEVLAEGVNLHRANTIVNYDTPWNSTRLMQRIGRVNRIGSKAPNVYIYNFYPTAKVDQDIDLQKRAFMKIQAFHAALGEDSQIYSNLEEFESYGLFNQQDEEKDRRLDFLMELRDFKRNYPDEFRRIKNIPKRARAGRENADYAQATITYMKKGKRDVFFWMNADAQPQALNFLQAADIFKALAEEKGIAIHELHHEHIQRALHSFDQEMQEEKARKQAVDTTMSVTEQQAINYLKPFIPSNLVNDTEKPALEWALKAIQQQGKFPNLTREIRKYKQEVEKKKKTTASLSNADIVDGLLKVVNSYYKHAFIINGADEAEVAPTETVELNIRPDIIISESFS